jgi:hypothetical protein
MGLWQFNGCHSLNWCRRLAFNPADALQFSVKRDANCRRGRPITRDRGALTHDDRIDAVAGAVADFQRAAMMMDVDQAAQAMKEAEIEDFPKLVSRRSGLSLKK